MHVNIENKISIFVLASLLVIGAQKSMAFEEAAYVVITKENEFEVREYAPHVVAETLVEGDQKEAANKAFPKLLRYISGANVSRAKVAMTAPVSQQAAGEKIQMTVPVGQQRVQNKWAVSFVMPKSYTLATLPQPQDASVVLRQVPAQKMAVVRYSGTWSEKNYLSRKSALESWVSKNGLSVAGEAVWARYNPPIMPWFLRRNEIMIPVN
jgi:SOUL heme-binding protein